MSLEEGPAGARSNAAFWVAVAAGVLTVVLAVLAVVLIVVNGVTVEVLDDDGTSGLLPFALFGVVGAVVAAKRPRNAVGWLMIAVGLGLVATTVGTQYARLGIINAPGAVPLPQLGKWVEGFGHIGFVAMPLTLLVFPTGRPPTRRWRVLVAWLGAMAVAGLVFHVWALSVVGPVTLTHVRVQDLEFPPVIGTIGVVSYFGTLFSLPLAGVAALLRFRRSRGVERQQLKWFAFAVLVALVVGPFAEAHVLARILSNAAVGAVPVAIGIAVIRYRLYDIDRLVRRTVTYAAVTAVLVGVYAVGVLGAGGIARSATGSGSDLVVAGSTLVAAALFRPVRRRVQAAVDRRFNRSQHDARLAVDDFAQRLRDEVDLDALRTELEAAAVRCVQPSAAGMWLPLAPGR